MDQGFHSSTDLRGSALRYLRLLDRIHMRRRQARASGKDERDVFHNAIHRYENFWLPMASEAIDSSELTPPWDIYFVWCLHILTSSAYRRYCKEKFGRVLDHRFHAHGSEEDASREKAKKLWEAKYSDEPFDINPKTITDVSRTNSELVEDLLQSEDKHYTFYYQVCLPHYRNARFLDDAKDRYYNLLLLKRKNPKADIYPAYDTELIRQAHVLHPCAYQKEMNAFFGEAIGFDAFDHSFDVVTNFDEEEKVALETTMRLWNVNFGSAYGVAGTKYRGNLGVCDNLFEPSHIHLKHTEPETIGIILDNISIDDVWSKDKQLMVEVRKLGETSNSYASLYRLSTKLGQKISTKNLPEQGRINLNLKKNRGIDLHIFGKTGRWCMASETHVANVFLDPRTLFSENEPLKSKEVFHEMPRISYGDPTINFNCKIIVDNVNKPYVFSLDRENFAPGPIPVDLKPFIKLASWTDLDLFDMDTFSTAQHSIPLIGGGFTYRCSVACCRDLDLGAILLYENNLNPITVAHTISNDQIPLPDQVTDKHPFSLETDHGEQAMLIRNKHGDWGACIMKPKGNHDDGEVQIVFEHLQKHYTTETMFSFEDSTELSIDNMTVDLYTGRVTLNPDCVETAEYVTLAYVIGVLYVFTTGHTLPSELERVNNNQRETVNKGYSTASKIRAKSSKKRYDIGNNNQSNRASHPVTLTNLKSRRKKRSLFCTMLLACGLKSNMMVEEDLSSMSFHSEVSLIPRFESGEDAKTPVRVMDDVHRHSFHQSSQELTQSIASARSSELFLRPTSAKFSFGPVDSPQTLRRQSNGRKFSETGARRFSESGFIPKGPGYDSDIDENDYEMPDFLQPGFLEERAQTIVQGVMAGAFESMEFEENVENVHKGFMLKENFDLPTASRKMNGHANIFISEGDDEAPSSVYQANWERFDETLHNVEDTRL